MPVSGDRRPLGPKTTVAGAVGAWLDHLGGTKASSATIAAYRRDIEGVARRIAERGDAGGLVLKDLDKGALRAAFASWSADHAAASVRRAHSAWTSFFDFLVAEDVWEGNPMAAVAKPEKAEHRPRAIRHPEAAARLLATAATADPRGRNPWPERDLALVATFCVTGIRVGEAVTLNMASLDGSPGARQLVVVGKRRKPRSIPVHDPLEVALARYLQTRAARYPRHDLDRPSTPLFVDARGRRLSADQIKYIIERLYVRAGIRSRVPPGALVHALRHTFAISARQAGAGVVELQALLGHASLETTRRYLDTAADGLREVTGSHPGQVALHEHLGAQPQN